MNEMGEVRGDLSSTGGAARLERLKRLSMVTNQGRGQVAEAWNAARRRAQARPLTTITGAAAVGAALGWLLPSGRRETLVMAEAAKIVTEAARDAADTAVEAARNQADEIAQKALASVGGAVVQAVIGGAPRAA